MITMPKFWNPANIRNLGYRANLYEARAEGFSHKRQSVTKQIRGGGGRHMIIMIDAETDFGDKGRLPVLGMYDGVELLCNHLIANIDFYTDYLLTIDKHPVHTIHASSWWLNERGQHPDVQRHPAFMMELVDPKDKAFRSIYLNGDASEVFYPRIMGRWTAEVYAPTLQKTGQGNIWVFADHCREMTDGVQLVPSLAEVVEYVSTVRDLQPIYLSKGMIAQTDWFGPFHPCVEIPNHPEGGWQTTYLDAIMGDPSAGIPPCDTVTIAGWAEDFCVNAGTLQLITYFRDEKKQPDVLKRFRFLSDCTAAIVPGSDVVKNLHAQIAAAGMQEIDHSKLGA